MPWLVWLSGLGAGLQTKGSPIQLPDQGTCLGCGPGPQWGVCNRTLIFLSLCLSPFLTLCLKINKIFKKKDLCNIFLTVRLMHVCWGGETQSESGITITSYQRLCIVDLWTMRRRLRMLTPEHLKIYCICRCKTTAHCIN